MLAWILAHKFIFVLLILLDGIVLNHLSAKQEHRGRTADLGYFWSICKHGDIDGIVAIVLTALAVMAGVLLGLALLFMEG